MHNFQSDLFQLREEISKYFNENIEYMDKHDVEAIKFIIHYLSTLIQEFQIGHLKQKNMRHPYITRMLTDNYTSEISVNFGKRLVEIEKKYIEY